MNRADKYLIGTGFNQSELSNLTKIIFYNL
jgi:hypothetical protein